MKLIGFSSIAVIIFALVVGIAIHLVLPPGQVAASSPAMKTECSDGWRITGYYTPVETEYTAGPMREIEIQGVGKESFNAEFLKTVFNDDEGFGEGWGKTRFGWYLGEYRGRWHKSDAPLDANDKPLEADTVAVDRSLIPPGSLVNIPNLPGDLGKLEFKSNDVGVSVHGKHIDVYTGEGRTARRKMYRFTYEEEDKGLTRVCFTPSTVHNQTERGKRD